MTAAPYIDWYKGERKQTLTTPRDFFALWHRKFNFTLDGAADASNALLERYSTAEHQEPWIGERVFCNPPWSSIPPFVELAATADLAMLLVPARPNARWFHRALELGAHPIFWKGKLRFGDAAHNSPVDCMLLLFGLNGTQRPVKPPSESVKE